MTVRLPRPIAIVASGVVSAHGFGFRGLSRAARDGSCLPRDSAQLAASHPGTASFELFALPEPSSVAERRARSMMSRSAVFASAATGAALEAAGWRADAQEIGFFLGVGASGGAVDQLEAMLEASIVDRAFSLPRFGDAGLRACNPLFAFQLMQNFTLCHAAIAQGARGPNAAFYSRGAGTVTALCEAAYAILEGDCDGALAGGADSAVHAVTWAELVRSGFAARGLVPGEGGAVYALADARGDVEVLGFVEGVAVWTARGRGVREVLAADANAGALASVDAIVLVPWGGEARDDLLGFSAEKLPQRPLLDASLLFGEALAAGPALGWALALDWLTAERFRRVAIVSAGLDGDVGVVVVCSGAAA